MAKVIKAYLVITSKGREDYYREHIERGFDNIESAYSFAEEFDNSHKLEERIPFSVWGEIEEAYYDYYDKAIENFCKDNNIPTQDEIQSTLVSRTEEQYRMVSNFVDKLNPEADDWCKNYLKEKYKGEYTDEDWDKTMEFHDLQYDSWNKSKIKEVEIVIENN